MGEANAFVCLGWREGLSSGSAVSEPELVRQTAEGVAGPQSLWSLPCFFGDLTLWKVG